MINFNIITPVYNAEKYIQKCLKSVIDQEFINWKIYIINDCSTDNTDNIIKKFISDNTLFEENIIYINKSQRDGALFNIVLAIDQIKSKSNNSIIVMLDGDDWFYSNDVFSYLNEIYKNKDIWLTYGQFIHSSTSQPTTLNKQLNDIENYRRSMNWKTSHLRTFRLNLYKYIRKEDLKELKTGMFYRAAWDLALMFPMIEMAGLKHIKFIEKVLYVYNDQNPLNDGKINLPLQVALAYELHAKPVYNQLNIEELCPPLS